jgi:DNA polymerase-3 subunit alpha
MSQPSFIHLRLHSEFSIVDGIVRVGDAVEAARRDGMPALALTDLKISSGLNFTGNTTKGIKPVLGCDVFVSNLPGATALRLLLLCHSRAGICVVTCSPRLSGKPNPRRRI